MRKKTKKIHVNPQVLKTLRENSGYSIKDVAKKLKVSEEKIKKVEREEDDFTLNQIKKLADIYKVPLAAFFSEEVPHLPSLPDYRVNREKKVPPSVNLAIRRAKYLSDMIYGISGRKTTLPKFPRDLSAKELADKLRKYLNSEAPRRVAPTKILDYYKKIVEEKLNVIVIEYPLKADDVRGFVIKDKLSVIVLNESDEATVKLFSLFHELGHLLRDEMGICSITMEEEKDVERYCNRFAAEFLMPEDEFREMISRYGKDYESLRKLQRIFGVSIHAMMIRLLNLGLISREEYEAFKRNVPEYKKSGGVKNWESTFRNRAGHLAIEEVSKAHKRGDLSFYEAMRILGVKLKYAEKLIG
ncbi:helix-turn-helix domain-containing protein (plasmid) [Campylobacterota bacterium DY0563]